MVTLTDGNKQHVQIDTLLQGSKARTLSIVRSCRLPRAADARRKHADVPLLIGREKRVAPGGSLC
jgi:hypothetical protein